MCLSQVLVTSVVTGQWHSDWCCSQWLWLWRWYWRERPFHPDLRYYLKGAVLFDLNGLSCDMGLGIYYTVEGMIGVHFLQISISFLERAIKSNSNSSTKSYRAYGLDQKDDIWQRWRRHLYKPVRPVGEGNPSPIPRHSLGEREYWPELFLSFTLRDTIPVLFIKSFPSHPIPSHPKLPIPWKTFPQPHTVWVCVSLIFD